MTLCFYKFHEEASKFLLTSLSQLLSSVERELSTTARVDLHSVIDLASSEQQEESGRLRFSSHFSRKHTKPTDVWCLLLRAGTLFGLLTKFGAALSVIGAPFFNQGLLMQIQTAVHFYLPSVSWCVRPWAELIPLNLKEMAFYPMNVIIKVEETCNKRNCLQESEVMR